MKAISIKQPWASLIVHGIKDIENRTWKCPQKYIGQRVLIHASSHIPFKDIEQLVVDRGISCWDDEYYPEGAIIGSVKIVGCTVNHSSVWAEKTPHYVTGSPPGIYKFITGQEPIYNWILAEPILFDKPIPAKGKLSFWEFDDELITK